MSDFIYNKLIIVYETSNFGIVCTASSDAHANAITLGMPNGKIIAKAKHLHPTVPSFNFDFNTADTHYQFTKKLDIVPLPEKFITEEWINFRKFTIRKAYLLSMWELRIRQNMNKTNDFFGISNILPFVSDQLRLCDPENNFYTTPINEWADIQNCSPESAYQELKLRYEGFGLVNLRSHALYLKYAREISIADTMEQATQAFEKGVIDLVQKAQLT